MSKSENEIDVLDELNKGACMGLDAITFLLPKVENQKLKKELEIQKKKYQEIVDKIAKVYPEYSKKHPHETSPMTKMMTWYGMEMKTMMDNSTSKIAELMLQGTNMGIIEGRRLLNNKNTEKEVNKLLQEYVDFQEHSIERLKKFL